MMTDKQKQFILSTPKQVTIPCFVWLVTARGTMTMLSEWQWVKDFHTLKIARFDSETEAREWVVAHGGLTEQSIYYLTAGPSDTMPDWAFDLAVERGWYLV